MKRFGFAAFVVALVAVSVGQTLPSELDADRIPSIKTNGNVFIHGGRVYTITQGVLEHGDVIVQNGKIVKVGTHLTKPEGATDIDATGLIVTPGIIDSHSHRGIDESNEWADSIVAEVRITDVLDPDQIGIYRALACGITSDLILHGSADAIGGQSVVIKNKWKRSIDEVIFPGAPRMIKFALGENPRGVNGRGPNDPIRYPTTRLGVESVYRRAFTDARDYMAKWNAYEKVKGDAKIAPPRRDLRLEALSDILRRKIWVNCHSYRQDEMLMMLRLSQEYGFHLVLHHALEGYKIAPELAKAGVGITTFGDGFDYKLEVVDSTPMATAIADAAGVTVAVNTDTFAGMVPLTQDAGKAMRYGMSEDHALRMVTINPAKELGIDSHVGSIEAGKDGDIALWSGHPLSVYSKCVMTLVDGNVEFKRKDVFHMDGQSAAAPSVAAKPFDPDAKTLKPSKSYLIRGATVHPISGPDLPVGDVLIVDGKISAVGKTVSGVPGGTTVVDGRGLQVYPGLIDAGSTLGLNEIGEVPQSQDTPENGDFHPDLWAATAVNPDSVQFPKVRFNGITSTLVRSTGSMFDGQASLMNTSGFTTETMAIEPRAALTVDVPAGVDPRVRDFLPPDQVKKQEDAVEDRRRQLREGFEKAKRYGELHTADGLAPRDLKLESLLPYVMGGRPVVFVANDRSSIRFAIKLSEDLKLKPIIAGGSEAWKIAGFLASKKVPVLLSPPSVACPDEDAPSGPYDPSESPLAAAAVLRRAGVQVAFQSDSFDMAMNLPYRVGRACAFGLSHEDGLKGLTLYAARILGAGDRLGSLEAGKMGNVIVTDGDPLELTTHVKYEFIGGQPVSLETHYTQLYKKYMGRVKEGKGSK